GLDKLGAEQLASGGLRGLQQKVRVGEQIREDGIVDTAGRRKSAVAVVALHATAEPPDGVVDQRVAWTRIESKHCLPLRARRYPCNVADATDVLHGATQLLVAKQQRIAPRGQRRTLTAGRDIARTEVCQRGHPEALGNDGRLRDLQRRASMPRRNLVPDR